MCTRCQQLLGERNEAAIANGNTDLPVPDGMIYYESEKGLKQVISVIFIAQCWVGYIMNNGLIIARNLLVLADFPLLKLIRATISPTTV